VANLSRFFFHSRPSTPIIIIIILFSPWQGEAKGAFRLTGEGEREKRERRQKNVCNMQIKPSSAQVLRGKNCSFPSFFFVHRSETQHTGEREREKDEKINTKIWKFSAETNMADKETFT
jgi:hypothetical protein